MPDYSEFVGLLKRISRETEEAGQPSDFCFGTVISASPLKVQVDQKLILTKDMLVVPCYLSDHKVKISYEGETDEKENHKHDIKITKKEVTIHNALKKDDGVILLRQRGGQSYLVLDRRAT